jgi:hypothetical protein
LELPNAQTQVTDSLLHTDGLSQTTEVSLTIKEDIVTSIIVTEKH